MVGEETLYKCFYTFDNPPLTSLMLGYKSDNYLMMRIVSHMMHDGCTRQGQMMLSLIIVIMWHVFFPADRSLRLQPASMHFLHVEITSFGF